MDTDDEEEIVIIHKKKEISPKEKEIKEFNKRMALEKREEKVRAVKERKEAERNAFYEKIACTELANFMNIKGNTAEHEILMEIINSNINHNLVKFNKVYGEHNSQTATRGPLSKSSISNIITYNKPKGFFGIALPVKAGSWLSKDGSDGEWIVAYHGTGL